MPIGETLNEDEVLGAGKIGFYNKLLYQAPEVVAGLLSSVNDARRAQYQDALSAYGVDAASANAYRQGWSIDQGAIDDFYENNRIPLAKQLMETVQSDPNVPDDFSVPYSAEHARVFGREIDTGFGNTGIAMPDWSQGPGGNEAMEAGLVPYVPGLPIGEAPPFLPQEAYFMGQASNLANTLTTYGNPNENKDPYYHDLQNPWANQPPGSFNPLDPQMQTPEFDYAASSERFTDAEDWQNLDRSGKAAYKFAAMGAEGEGLLKMMALKSAALGVRNLDTLATSGEAALSEQQAATQSQLDNYDTQYAQYEAAMNDFRNTQDSQIQFDLRADKYVRDMRDTYDNYKNVSLGKPSGGFGTFGGGALGERRERIDAPGTYLPPPYDQVVPNSNRSWANQIAIDMGENTADYLQQASGYGINRGQDIAGARPTRATLPSAGAFSGNYTETKMPEPDNRARDYSKKLQKIARMAQINANT